MHRFGSLISRGRAILASSGPLMRAIRNGLLTHPALANWNRRSISLFPENTKSRRAYRRLEILQSARPVASAALDHEGRALTVRPALVGWLNLGQSCSLTRLRTHTNISHALAGKRTLGADGRQHLIPESGLAFTFFAAAGFFAVPLAPIHACGNGFALPGFI
jgi:hypothetical protein